MTLLLHWGLNALNHHINLGWMKPPALSVVAQRESRRRTNSRCLWASYVTTYQNIRSLLKLQILLFCSTSSSHKPRVLFNIFFILWLTPVPLFLWRPPLHFVKTLQYFVEKISDLRSPNSQAVLDLDLKCSAVFQQFESGTSYLMWCTTGVCFGSHSVLFIHAAFGIIFLLCWWHPNSFWMSCPFGQVNCYRWSFACHHSQTARNFRVFLNHFYKLVKKASTGEKTTFYQLPEIAKVKPYLPLKDLEKRIYAFVTSRLDYCSSLYFSVENLSLHHLQLVQNAAACLLTAVRSHDHITRVLYEVAALLAYYLLANGAMWELLCWYFTNMGWKKEKSKEQ